MAEASSPTRACARRISTALNGKILRVNDDGTAPADNPFYDGNPNSNRSKVWAYGLRNPFRFVLHPETGIPYVGDVGWNEWEELDIASRGRNLGWPCYEGLPANRSTPRRSRNAPRCNRARSSAPFFTYGRSVGASVLAGAFLHAGPHTPSSIAASCSSPTTSRGSSSASSSTPTAIRSSFPMFAIDLRGARRHEAGPGRTALLRCLRLAAQIRRIRFNGPTGSASASPTDGYSPLAVTFSSADPRHQAAER